MATESIAKKVIVKGIHDSIPNYVASGMDATEGTSGTTPREAVPKKNGKSYTKES